MKSLNKKKGVTLIEAIISVALLSILIIPISSLVMNSLNNNKKAEVKQKAAYVGQKILEEMKVYNGMALNVTDANNTKFQLLDGGELTKINDNKYTAELIRTVDGEASGLKFKVDLTLEKDTDFKYDGTDNLAENGDADHIINLSKEGTSIKVDYKETSYSVSDKLILKIENDMKIALYNKGEATPIFFNIPDDTSNVKEKILIRLSRGYGDATSSLEVQNHTNKDVEFYIVKNNEIHGDINVNCTLGNITMYEGLLETEESKVGTLYKIAVSVKDNRNDNVLFEGDTSSNINIK